MTNYSNHLAQQALELLRCIWGQRSQDIELASSGEPSKSPPVLPAIRLEVVDSRLDNFRGFLHGEVKVFVYDDPFHKLSISPAKFTTASGNVYVETNRLLSGSIGKVSAVEPPVRRVLLDGSRVTIHYWSLERVFPKVPIIKVGTVAKHDLDRFTQSIVHNIARYSSVSAARAAAEGRDSEVPRVGSRLLSASCEDDAAGSRRIHLRILVWPIKGACSFREAGDRAMATLDRLEGRSVPILGKVSRVVVERTEPLPNGLAVTATLLVSYAPPEAAESAPQAA